MCQKFCFHVRLNMVFTTQYGCAMWQILSQKGWFCVHPYIALWYLSWVVRFRLLSFEERLGKTFSRMKVGRSCTTQILLTCLCSLVLSNTLGTLLTLLLFISQSMFLALTLTLKSHYCRVGFLLDFVFARSSIPCWVAYGARPKKGEGPLGKEALHLCLFFKKVGISITLGWTW